jgi:HPt (histidine-containing phosphotransfer) domain-containing protein
VTVEHDRTHKSLFAGENVVIAASLMAQSDPPRGDSVIDETHLARMTLGDRSLEREILEIFARQIVLLLERIAGAEPARAAAAAHTLKGSASGIGAWRVARAAERLERAAAGEGDHEAVAKAIAELEAAGLEVRCAIGARLGDRPDQPAAAIFGLRSSRE